MTSVFGFVSVLLLLSLGVALSIWAVFATVLVFCLFFEKELKFGWVWRGEDLKELGSREEYTQCIFKLKNGFK